MMDAKSASKKLQAASEQGAVIKFSMPAGPESDEFYSNLVRKFGQDAVSRTVKENCSTMSPRSKSSTTETVCSLTKIEAVNDSFHQQLTATLKQDIDWNFIDFVIDYLLSSDKDGQQAADVDKLIQNYVKLNPQLREQFVNMLKNLAEAKEVKIESSHEAATVLPKKTVKVNSSDKVNQAVKATRLASSSNSPSSSRSPTRHSPTLSASTSSSDVTGISTPDVAESSSSTPTEHESPESTMPAASAKLKALATTVPAKGEDNVAGSNQSILSSPQKTSPKQVYPPRPAPPLPPPLQVGYVRVVGATSKALQLLRLEDHCVDKITLVKTTPRRIDDSDCDEVFQFANCTYDELVRLDGTAASKKKKKKRNKKKNKKKNNSGAAAGAAADEDDEDENVVESETCVVPGIPQAAGNEEPSPAGQALAGKNAAWQDVEFDDLDEADEGTAEAVKRLCELALFDGVKGVKVSERENSMGSGCGLEKTSTRSGVASTVLAITKPLLLAKDIESRTPKTLARPEMLLDGEFSFRNVSPAECGVVTSWDDLKELVAEVFPNDSELQEAFATKAHNSLDLWKFIVKYGRMYKDFVSEVLEMVNELKKGLIDAMDMHREKTSEILETHKKEMGTVVEKARAADFRIEELEKELEDHRLSADDQRVKAFTQEEEIQKLQKSLTAKEKRIKDFDNVKKELLADRNKTREERDRFFAEHEQTKSELAESQAECESLRTRLQKSWDNFEAADYRVRELESKLCDERTETEKYKESNALLTKKLQSLQNEVARLRENETKQRKIEEAKQLAAASSHLQKNAQMKNNSSQSSHSTRAVPSSSPSPSRSSFFPSVISPQPSSTTNTPYHGGLTSRAYTPYTASAVGMPPSKTLSQNFQNNNQPSPVRPPGFPSRKPPGLENARTSYAAASAGNSNGAIGQRCSFPNSQYGELVKEKDSEVHSLLTPSDPTSDSPGDFLNSSSGNRNRPMFNDVRGASILNSFREVPPRDSESSVPSSQPSFASLFTNDESQAYSPTYSYWGKSTYGFSPTSGPLLFNIKPSSLSPDGPEKNPQFPDPGLSSPDASSEEGWRLGAPDQNATKRNQSFTDHFGF